MTSSFLTHINDHGVRPAIWLNTSRLPAIWPQTLIHCQRCQYCRRRPSRDKCWGGTSIAEATQRAPENTLRDSAMARALQAEEKLWSERTAAARGTFQVCKENVLISFRSSTNYDDKELNLPGVRFGDTLEGAAVDGSDGLVYVRVSAAGVQ